MNLLFNALYFTLFTNLTLVERGIHTILKQEKLAGEKEFFYNWQENLELGKESIFEDLLYSEISADLRFLNKISHFIDIYKYICFNLLILYLKLSQNVNHWANHKPNKLLYTR